MGWMEKVGLRKSAETDAAVAVATAEGERQGMTGSPFAPMMPLRPTMGVGGQPRAWDVPAGYNTRSRADRDKGRMSFAALKDMTDNYDVASMCIAHRINDVRSLPWSIVPAEGVTSNVEQSIEIARRLMKKPDRQTPFNSWLAMYLEDVLRYDAGTLYKRKDRIGRIYGLEVVSGPTIAPVLDGWGRRPVGDAPAFVQFIQGQPVKWFTSDDLIYQPFRPQSDSPYGIAPLESVLLPANTDIRFQMHFLNYFTQGTVPEGFIILPEQASNAQQMQEFQELYDAYFFGDDTKKRGMRVMPFGTEIKETKDAAFDVNFPMFLLKKVCAAYKVTPADIGFTEDVNKSSGDSQADVQFRVGTLPLVQHVQGILTSFLQDDLGLPVEFQFDTNRDSEDMATVAAADEIHIRNGVISIDEVREMRYGKAIDTEEPIQRFVVVQGQGLMTLHQLKQMSGPTDTETLGPDSNAPAEAFPALPAAGGEAANAPQDGATPGEASATTPVTDSMTDETAAVTSGPGVNRYLTPDVLAHLFAGSAKALTKSLREDLDDGSGVQVAGAAVKARDTGRVLMIQRCLDDDDPAAGTWEFPGGHLEPGEDPIDAAIREWEEECGLPFPRYAMLSGEWSSGPYVGLVFTIPEEAAVPINQGFGEDGETLAWFDPDHLPGMPALRPELARTLPKEQLAKAMREELLKWKSNTRTRLKRGQEPRRFNSEALSTDLVEGIYTVLKSAKDEDSANRVFDAAIGATAGGGLPKASTPPSWRDEPPVTTPYHSVDLPLTDHYAPRIREAMRSSISGEALRSLVAEAIGGMHLLGSTAPLQAAVEADALYKVLEELWQDAYHAGSAAARVQLGKDTGKFQEWKPGVLSEPMPTSLSWNEALLQANIELRGITRTTLDRIGQLIVDGVKDGLSVDELAKGIDEYLGNESRAELIAHTETARMATLGTEATYREAGITQWDLVISAGACPTCTAIASQNPHMVGERSVQPPVHPRCRCAMAPVATSIKNPFE